MSNPKVKPYTKTLKEIMSRKSEILSKARAFWEVGMTEMAQPLWLSAATYEEIWKEGNMYTSYCPELDVVSCGRNIDEARKKPPRNY